MAGKENFFSLLTLFKLDEMLARYASYIELAEIIRIRFKEPSTTLKELFGRLVFNILCGNTDDHARNHAAFWDGENYNLTPAYDICPQYRAGNKSSQAMIIYKDKDEASNLSLLENAIKSCAHFSLTEAEAVELIVKQLTAIGDNWGEVCRESAISKVDRALLENVIFLNPFIFEGKSSSIEDLRILAENVKRTNEEQLIKCALKFLGSLAALGNFGGVEGIDGPLYINASRELCGKVHNIVAASIHSYYKKTAEKSGIKNPAAGSISFLQRFSILPGTIRFFKQWQYFKNIKPL